LLPAAFFYLLVLVLILFVFGSITSALMINFGRRKGMTRIYAYNLILEALLLCILTIVDLRPHTAWRNSTLGAFCNEHLAPPDAIHDQRPNRVRG
jgi:hypothetical protein